MGKRTICTSLALIQFLNPIEVLTLFERITDVPINDCQNRCSDKACWKSCFNKLCLNGMIN